MNMERLYYDEKQKLLSELQKEIQEQKSRYRTELPADIRDLRNLQKKPPGLQKQQDVISGFRY